MAAQVEEVDVNVGADWSNYPDMPEVEEKACCGSEFTHAKLTCSRDPRHTGLHATEGVVWGYGWI